MPPPVGIALSENDVRTSAPVCDTEPRYAPVVLPVPGRARVAVPGVTDRRVAPAEAVHGPPTSAVPRPPDTVRPNASEAIAEGAAGGGAVTVTSCEVRPVAPSSSVTVTVTG